MSCPLPNKHTLFFSEDVGHGPAETCHSTISTSSRRCARTRCGPARLAGTLFPICITKLEETLPTSSGPLRQRKAHYNSSQTVTLIGLGICTISVPHWEHDLNPLAQPTTSQAPSKCNYMQSSLLRMTIPTGQRGSTTWGTCSAFVSPVLEC